MTMNRLVCPASELAMPDWIRSTALDDLMGMDFEPLGEDSLYRNLDRLHPCRAAIESALLEHEQTLFNLDRTVFLYDLTSTYFEGRATANPKAKRGYSRDKRRDCKQVIVGLAVNRDGFYMLLTRAENAFRSMKSPLMMRPIHHRREERVETHIFLSVLAYHLLVAIEKTLLDQEVHTSWATVRETLRTHQVCTVLLPADGGSVLRIRRASTPEPQHVELYALLGVPTKIMAPRKTWSEGEAPHSDGKNA
jgi:hypothetical protein